MFVAVVMRIGIRRRRRDSVRAGTDKQAVGKAVQRKEEDGGERDTQHDDEDPVPAVQEATLANRGGEKGCQ